MSCSRIKPFNATTTDMQRRAIERHCIRKVLPEATCLIIIIILNLFCLAIAGRTNSQSY